MMLGLKREDSYSAGLIGGDIREWQVLFPFGGKICGIVSREEWKEFSTWPGRVFPSGGDFTENPSWGDCREFGTPIASSHGTDCHARNAYYRS
jgi:hypothetical protein